MTDPMGYVVTNVYAPTGQQAAEYQQSGGSQQRRIGNNQSRVSLEERRTLHHSIANLGQRRRYEGRVRISLQKAMVAVAIGAIAMTATIELHKRALAMLKLRRNYQRLATKYVKA